MYIRSVLYDKGNPRYQASQCVRISADGSYEATLELIDQTSPDKTIVQIYENLVIDNPTYFSHIMKQKEFKSEALIAVFEGTPVAKIYLGAWTVIKKTYHLSEDAINEIQKLFSQISRFLDKDHRMFFGGKRLTRNFHKTLKKADLNFKPLSSFPENKLNLRGSLINPQ